MSKYVCIAVPYWLGDYKPERTEVESIRKSGIADELGANWVDIQPDFASYDDALIAVNRALAEAIQAHADKVPLVFAADCTSCLGMMKGLQAQSPAILWFDSHGDFNTPETSPSGFLGGMPLAALVGRGNQHWIANMGLSPIPESDVMITDVRNLDPEEGAQLRASDVTIFDQVDDLLSASMPEKALYIHFDTDVVDSAEMPAMSYPEGNGPSLKQTVDSLQYVINHAQVSGILFGLWNDSLDGADVALAATLELVRTLK